jgi:hypothetical protein
MISGPASSRRRRTEDHLNRQTVTTAPQVEGLGIRSGKSRIYRETRPSRGGPRSGHGDEKS